MSLTGILALVVVGGLAAGAYYYRDGIKDAFASTQKSDEEKQYDYERKKEQDAQWDAFLGRLDPANWFNNTNKPSENTKQVPKYTPFKQIEVIDPQTGQPTITVIPNTGIKNPRKEFLDAMNRGWK